MKPDTLASSAATIGSRNALTAFCTGPPSHLPVLWSLPLLLIPILIKLQYNSNAPTSSPCTNRNTSLVLFPRKPVTDALFWEVYICSVKTQKFVPFFFCLTLVQGDGDPRVSIPVFMLSPLKLRKYLYFCGFRRHRSILWCGMKSVRETIQR